MRKIAAITAAAILTITGIVAAAPAEASTSQYVTWVRSNVDGAQYLTRTQIVKMGKTICTSLDNDVDIYELGEIAMDSGYTTEEAAAWVVGAVYFVCPRHKWMLS
jgi:Protein of unknown function (DUF732)